MPGTRVLWRVVVTCALAMSAACTSERITTGAEQSAMVALAKPGADVQFGTAANDAASSVAVGKSGVAIAGITSGALDGQVNAGGSDAYVRLFDKRGVEVWSHQFGSAADDGASGVAIDRSGVYVAGTTSGALGGVGNLGASDGYVRALDASGSIRWQTRLASAGADSVFGIAADRDAIYATGVLRGPQEGTTVSDADGFVVKLDALTGEILWLTRFVGLAAGDDAARAVAVNGDGVFVAATYYLGTGGAGPGGDDAYMVRIDALTGAFVWQSSVASPAQDIGHSVSHGGSAVFLVGTSADDAFAAAFDPLTGALHWKTTLTTAGVDVATASAADRSTLHIGGWTTGAFTGATNAGMADAIYATLDATTGAIRTVDQFGTTGMDATLGAFLDGRLTSLVGATGGALSGVYLGGLDAWWMQRATR